MPATTMEEPEVHAFFESVTGSWQYVVADTRQKTKTNDAVIIDPVLDYDRVTGKVSTHSADQILALVADRGYTVTKILETHAHADHLSASRYLQNILKERQRQSTTAPRLPQVCIGHRIRQVQETMSKIYGVPDADLGDAFDHVFADGETFAIGSLQVCVLHLPGHTPDHIGYVVGSNVFTGDSLFNPDVGSARCDFPGGSATDLFRSMQRLLSLPGHFRLYTGHDYPPDSRDVPVGLNVEGSKAMPFTTVDTQARENKHVKRGTRMEDFVAWRSERDSSLAAPKLLAQAMQVNIRGGRLPAESSEGFKITEVPERVVRVPKAAAA
ncbi:hypothetical protein AYL99_06123 [Fonsecaea erecta]|uniref:Metallo-beta-lactamase domain-containing protein n=1 Tax=Fonsecaea erecta TaxID=1367422 RepID=A0A178ZHA2_9EURO|nr:hypothetical protein AYL99_06123 [Fonsecaea erecta]OAP58826.1 hypothetical protein AYL99_06123 [Fonsecaea erecta]